MTDSWELIKIRNIRSRSLTGRAVYTMALLLIGSLLFVCAGSIACSTAPAAAEKDQVTMDILNNAMVYIKAHHPDAAALTKDDLAFTTSTGGKRVVGYTGITYAGGGWTISIGHAVTPETIYDVRAEYNSGKIIWTGLSKNGQITEVSYAINEK